MRRAAFGAPAAPQISAEAAAQLAVNKTAGKAAEAKGEADLVAKGINVVGRQVSVRVNGSRRVIDLLIEGKKGRLIAIEVKSGNAVKTAKQIADDKTLAAIGGKFVGKNAPQSVLNTSRKFRTITVRVP